MKNRFKFRARFSETYSYTNENEEEKTVEFYINNVGICEYGYITFSQDDLKKALKDKKLSNSNIEEVVDQMQNNNSNSEDNDYFLYDFYKSIEQCTGLKIKDKLLYDKDKVKLDDGIYIVEWDEEEVGYVFRNQDTGNCLNVCEFVDAEIIGNIYENSKLSE